MDLRTGGVRSARGLASTGEECLNAFPGVVISSKANLKGVLSKQDIPRVIMAVFTARALGDTVTPGANLKGVSSKLENSSVFMVD